MYASQWLRPQYMRVGAESADRLVKPWPATVYKALADLNKATGMQYIVGTNQVRVGVRACVCAWRVCLLYVNASVNVCVCFVGRRRGEKAH